MTNGHRITVTITEVEMGRAKRYGKATCTVDVLPGETDSPNGLLAALRGHAADLTTKAFEALEPTGTDASADASDGTA